MVQEYKTKAADVARHEAHKKYVDIQWIVEGKERIDVAPVSVMEVEEPYSEETDVMFFREPQQATQVVLTAGGYVVLYPEDSHKPGMTVDDQVTVKKIVGKVRV